MLKKKKELATKARNDSKNKIKREQAAGRLINHVYSSINGRHISRSAGVVPDAESPLTYGEIDPLAFIRILNSIPIKPGDTFYDLGSGTGKAVLIAGLAFPFAKCTGVEIVEELSAAGNTALQSCLAAIEASQLASSSTDNVTKTKTSGSRSVNKRKVDSICSTEAEDFTAAVFAEIQATEGGDACVGVPVEGLAQRLVSRLGRKKYKRGLHGHGGLLKFLQRLESTEATCKDGRFLCITDDGQTVKLVPRESADDAGPDSASKRTCTADDGTETSTSDVAGAGGETETGGEGDVINLEEVGVVVDREQGQEQQEASKGLNPTEEVGEDSSEKNQGQGVEEGADGGAPPHPPVVVLPLTDLAVLAQPPPAPMRLVVGDMLEDDWSSASVVFAASLLFPPSLMVPLARCAEKLAPGTFFITLKPLPSDQFRTLRQAYYAMSWGSSMLYVQQRI